jgi:hypothetical protein
MAHAATLRERAKAAVNPASQAELNPPVVGRSFPKPICLAFVLLFASQTQRTQPVHVLDR